MAEPNLLAIQKELKDLESMYAEKPSTDTSNFFITGESGSGKTCLIETAPGPILVDSWDPRGTESILTGIRSGRVYVDTRWEYDDPKTAATFDQWERTFFQRKRDGLFATIGTYAIDSSTGMLKAIMNKVLKQAGRPGSTPQQNDWLPQMTIFENVMNVVANLPCNVMVTNHLDMKEDQATGQLLMRPMVTGKLNVRVPLLFSEIYVMETKATSKGIEYSVLTQSTGRYMARTRIGKGVFEPREKPNIAELLRKAGKPFADKEIRGA